MLIPITIAHSSSEPKLPPGLAKISHDEIVLIELQGTLEVESNHHKERNGKLVGTLKIDEITVFIELPSFSYVAPELTGPSGQAYSPHRPPPSRREDRFAPKTSRDTPSQLHAELR